MLRHKGLQDDADLSEYVRPTASTVYHPARTCKLGAVVDPQLQVRGVDGLRIADASIFPTLTTINSAITVMIGDRCASRIQPNVAL